jgi:signal transduction histidine kinase
MGNHLTQTEDKLFLLKHAPLGMAEIDATGTIAYQNKKAEAFLKQLANSPSGNTGNIFDILSHQAPELVDEIKNFIAAETEPGADVAGCFSHSLLKEKKINLTLNKIQPGSFLVCFEEKTTTNLNGNGIQQALHDKAVIQGKFEIAANVLHDIGNAIVGLSSFTNRIKRTIELDNADNLQNLCGFFQAQYETLQNTFGQVKADAIIKLVNGIAQTQKEYKNDLINSNREQLQIITHIQDIINIQRQYLNGSETMEKKPVYIGSLIKDCLSMLFASFNKRSISLQVEIPEELPVIKGDRTKLMQVMLNILKNSIEAIDFYAIEKSVLIKAEQHGDTLTMTIQDSGKGFDEATGKKLFTRGFTTKDNGTGLGLEHCKVIMEHHGGAISIASDGPGKGAVTTLLFKI